MKFWQRREWRTVDMKTEGPPLKVVSDAAIAIGEVGEGRLIPLIIVDATPRPDLKELIRVHQFTPPGDVSSQWLAIEGEKMRVGLLLTFSRPSKLTTIIHLDADKQAPVIDQILTAQSLYLQAGAEGDRFITTRDAPKILVEVPAKHFLTPWNEIYHKVVFHRLRKEGFSRQQAKEAARDYINNWRQFGNLRKSIR